MPNYHEVTSPNHAEVEELNTFLRTEVCTFFQIFDNIQMFTKKYIKHLQKKIAIMKWTRKQDQAKQKLLAAPRVVEDEIMAIVGKSNHFISKPAVIQPAVVEESIRESRGDYNSRGD